MNQSSLLQVSRLSLVRPSILGNERVVVRDLSFSMSRGQVLALTGEDGGGMSALAQAVASLLPRGGLKIKQGNIYLDGEDLVRMSPRKLRRRRLAYFDRHSTQMLNPLCSIRQHLMEAVAWKTIDERKSGQNLIQGLYQVGLAEPESILDRLPAELSPEELSRVVIAMALQAGADFIVVDEMTAHLDATVEQQILELLVDLKNQQGLSILLVTHHPGIIEAMADVLVVMFEGVAIEQGKVADVLFASGNPYVKALMGCAPRLGEGRLRLGEITEAERQAAKALVEQHLSSKPEGAG